MYRVKFIGERERPATGEVAIAGLVFHRGQELRLSNAQTAALRAHPQFEQFEFNIKVSRSRSSVTRARRQ